MKKALLLFLIFGFCQWAWAGNLKAINEKSMALFLQIMPRYSALLEKYGQAADPHRETDIYNFNQELQSLFARFDADPNEFSTYLHRVIAGYTALSDPTRPIDITYAELAVIEKYQDQIRQILN